MSPSELLVALEKLRDAGLIDHSQCEDSWFSCPLSHDGCSDRSQGDACNCGADKHNENVEAAYAEAVRLVMINCA